MRYLVALVSLVALLTVASVAQDSAQPTPASLLAGDVVATVDGSPIYSSQIDLLLDLELIPGVDGEEEVDRRRRVLDLLIGDRLRSRELEKLGLAAEDPAEPPELIAALKRQLPGYDEVLSGLQLSDFDPEKLASELSRQVMVLTFAEERLGRGVFISDDEIESYYRRQVESTYRRRGETAPTLEEVRSWIRATLREDRLLEELGEWTEELRGQSDIRLAP